MSWIFWTILVPVLILGVLIFLHELGHFLVAKWCGVGVVRFAVGFGPPIWKKRIGDTEYRLGVVPLGGYVRMVGDISDLISGPETQPEVEGEPVPDIPPELLADKSKWFVEKSLSRRSAIVAAGPIFNFVTAILFIAAAIFFYGDVKLDEQAVVGQISGGSPAEVGGLQPGDLVRKFNGEPVTRWEELAKRIHSSGGESISLTVLRGSDTGVSEELDLVLHPQRKVIPGIGKEVFLVGISPKIDRTPVSFSESLKLGGKWVVTATTRTVEGIYGMLTGQVSAKELAGPVFIFGAASQAAQKGMEYVLDLMANLSVSLAVLNLLPIPILDGGHLLFFLFEAIFGPISIRKREVASQVGLAVLLLLMGVALTNDIRRTREESPAKQEIQWNTEEKR
jgi:regulator of sigma E protease